MIRARARFAAAVTAVAIAAAGLVAVAAPAHAATTYTRTAPAGTWLRDGDQVTSPNGQFRLVMQADGNLVEYGIGNVVLWASNTANQYGAAAVVQKEGPLSIIKNGKLLAQWGPTSSPTKGLRVGVDGTLTLLNTSNATTWKLQTFQNRVPAGTTILPGTVLRSGAGRHQTFTMQADGNLVQYVNSTAPWSSGTFRHPGATAAVQADGNLVVYPKGGGKALWASNTSNKGGGALLVQLDSNVVLYGKADTRSWSTRKVTGLQWPVAGTTITGRYGDDRGAGHVPRYHQGTDAPVKVGTPVYASGTGRVTTVVRNHASYGNYVVVTYGLTTVLTAHMSSIAVKKDQVVSLGTQLGKSGNTGQSTGPHVHVETRVNGTLKDPLTILAFR
ncbi:peptidoglycan DD-metalloendopeptidase family protein [Curtobacterium herbarum]|uniref:Bulb-type lectin domain-containing protein n=1 Tax=Curtobacterium herbarum TaxID=150122 RepID=A0ABN1ZDU4_9MICO|nr:peptidoglycan DD-metalloendopeptidase family protein [Curtobacterium herbarum]MBM7476810.1 murein DD-endopeptidase MepM/ murein hydrolase activator NlpD [Curtobacterium herbarum]MCS6545177.1 peptidoglycan DD-metalloendopeptidase family protein [Curtobacterium herbarum]